MSRKRISETIVTNIKKIAVFIFMSKFFDRFWPDLTRNHVPIFMLHRIEDKSRNINGHDIEMIDALLNKLSQHHYNFISLNDLVECIKANKPVPTKSVVFTMDDGYIDQGSIAAPVFIKYKCPLTIFLISDFMDGISWPWDSQLRYIFLNTHLSGLSFEHMGRKFKYGLNTYDQRYESLRDFRNYCKTLAEEELRGLLEAVVNNADVRLSETPEDDYLHLSWQDARELEKKGIDFAPHSMSHRILSNLSDASVTREINSSWERLHAELKRAKKIFCYPTGKYNYDFSAREIAILSSSDYNAAVSADHGYFDVGQSKIEKSSLFCIKRITMPHDLSDALLYCSKFSLLREAINPSLLPRYILRVTKLECLTGSIAVRTCMYIVYLNILNRLGKFNQYKLINLTNVKRIIFLCTGNVCRSAFAEWYAKALTNKFEFLSYGVEAQEGRKPHFLASYVARNTFSIDMKNHATSNINNHDFKNGDLIIAMDPGQLDLFRKISVPDGVQFTLLGLWSNKPMPLIFDPYGMSEADFIKCFDILIESIKNLISKLDA